MRVPITNLLTDKVIPVVRVSGKREKISLCDVTSDLSDPVERIDTVRQDFEIYFLEICHAAIQTMFSPKDDPKWQELLKKPPTPAQLKTAFKHYTQNFQADVFMQGSSSGTYNSVVGASLLLIESPGEATVKAGRDFLYRDKEVKLCQACAMVALYGHNVHAGAGGQGHMRSPRACSINMLATGKTLWETIWLNVLPLSRVKGNPNKALPWVMPYREIVEKSDPYEAFWLMPRRTRLVIKEQDTTCSVCGEHTVAPVVQVMRTPGSAYKERAENPLLVYHKSSATDKKGTSSKKVTISASKLSFPGYAEGGFSTPVLRLMDLKVYPEGIRLYGPELDQLPLKTWHDVWHPWFETEKLEKAAKKCRKAVKYVASLVRRTSRPEYDSSRLESDLHGEISKSFDVSYAEGSWDAKLGEICLEVYDRHTASPNNKYAAEKGRILIHVEMQRDGKMDPPARLPRSTVGIGGFMQDLWTWWEYLKYCHKEGSRLGSCTNWSRAFDMPLVQRLVMKYESVYGQQSHRGAKHRALTELAMALSHVQTPRSTIEFYDPATAMEKAKKNRSANIFCLAKTFLT